MRNSGFRLAILAATSLSSIGCGRISFDPTGDAKVTDPTDAGACTGDFLVDVADDDPAEALACGGAGCSLRSAVAQANARGLSTICVADDLSIALSTPLLVSADIKVTGSNTSICGTGSSRVFQVAAGGTLRLLDLTVCHGRVTDSSGGGVAVESGGALYADRVVFDDNVAVASTTFQEGGAVFATGDAIVEIRSSRFINNRILTAGQSARGGAFGIRATGAARVVFEDTAFEDNRADYVGGAMFLVINGASITMERLLFARNSAPDGGAVDINCASSGTFAIENSTFADNVATNNTIFVCGTQTLRLSFCSFSGNTGAALVRLDNGNGGIEWRANAIASPVDLCSGAGTNTSFDGNIATRDGALCPLSGANDRLQDPMLAPLADNGGPTASVALLPGSPAIDAAGAVCPPVDQRGVTRPARAACDVGAFEAE